MTTSYNASLANVGDLFFNTDNRNLDSLYNRDDSPCQSDVRAAVLEDAIEFTVNLGQAGNGDLIDWLVAHYLARL